MKAVVAGRRKLRGLFSLISWNSDLAWSLPPGPPDPSELLEDPKNTNNNNVIQSLDGPCDGKVSSNGLFQKEQ